MTGSGNAFDLLCAEYLACFAGRPVEGQSRCLNENRSLTGEVFKPDQECAEQRSR